MELEAGVREALDAVYELGQADGNEHAIVVRAGREVARNTDGLRESVTVDQLGMREGDILIHNHPSLNALSNGDVVQLYVHGLSAVYAISTDRSVYKAEPKMNLFPDDFMEVSQLAAGIVMLHAGIMGVGKLRDTAEPGYIGVGHWMNRMMASKGMIRYSFALEDETRKMVQELDRKLRFPYAHVGAN